MIAEFLDEDEVGFYFTGSKTEKVLIRVKEFYDSAVPSGNSIQTLNLLLLSKLTEDEKLSELAENILEKIIPKVLEQPSGYYQFLNAIDFYLGPSFEIFIVGEVDEPNTLKMLKTVYSSFIPNKVVLLKNSEADRKKLSVFGGTFKRMKKIDNKPTVYVCSNFVCKKPTADILVVKRLLNVG